MNDLLGFTITMVLTVSSLALLLFIVKLLHAYMKKDDMEYEQKDLLTLLSELDDIIRTCVIATNETAVKMLKASGSFYQMDKEEAFEGTREKIISIAGKKNLLKLEGFIGDINYWIDNRIEYYVRESNKTEY